MISLTKAQRKVLGLIESHMAEAGFPPTFRALQSALGFRSVNSVQTHVKALIQKGFLKKEAGRARGITPSHRAQALSIPILGAVTAGVPKEAIEYHLGAIPVPERIGKKGHCFALKVKGDSMVGAGIHEGDMVIVRQQHMAEDREIVVALVDGESTVKRYRRKKGESILLAENPNYPPIPISSEKDVIQGKVIGVCRYFE